MSGKPGKRRMQLFKEKDFSIENNRFEGREEMKRGDWALLRLALLLAEGLSVTHIVLS